MLGARLSIGDYRRVAYCAFRERSRQVLDNGRNAPGDNGNRGATGPLIQALR
jgi:hypothetical protein